MAMLKFATFSSDIELPFYTALASHKINHDKLDDSARRVLGLYELKPAEEFGGSCRMQLHGNALTGDDVPTGFYRAEGMIKNFNTIEEYRAFDKTALLNRAGRTIWDAICDGTIYSCPSLLTSFSVVCFADLKKYKFTYLFAFPALISEPSWKFKPQGEAEGSPISMKPDDSTALVDAVQTWRYSVDTRQYGFFLAKKVQKSLGHGSDSKEPTRPFSTSLFSPNSPSSNLDYSWSIGTLSAFEKDFFQGIAPEDRFVCFADPSTYPQNPGWMLRNLLVLIRRRWSLDEAQILCYRDVQSRRHEARSIILQLKLDEVKKELSTTTDSTEQKLSQMPKVTGWERGPGGKVISQIANLGEYMDPQRLADQAVDLNLKLIKWRIAPGLDLDTIKNTKCLLLGAGTLGSYVARNLMGWGVRKITFVDNGSVSFSNPVRQPLFNFQDCLSGGAKKATRAAEALKEIYPGVESEGYVLSVPMAGHPIIDEAKTKTDYETLKRLVDEHDVIFLLMDTRESRWLPTLMGKATGKLVMNAALGFDTFVVMRHGIRNPQKPGQELGCYFCNDVVAPADSLTDRTLDQQCTVTRPGGAAIASALLVEIMVSVLQDKLKGLALAPPPGSEERGENPLGVVPHQIRGFLATFRNMVISGRSYDCCSACSDRIVDAYKKNGWSFLRKALNEKGYVEELSGLAEIQRAAEKAAADVEWDEEEEEEEGVDEGEGELL